MISLDWTCVANFLCFLSFLFLILSLHADFSVCRPPAFPLFYLVISVLRASTCVLPCFSTNCMRFWQPVAVWTCMGLVMRLLAWNWLWDDVRPCSDSKIQRVKWGGRLTLKSCRPREINSALVIIESSFYSPSTIGRIIFASESCSLSIFILLSEIFSSTLPSSTWKSSINYSVYFFT